MSAGWACAPANRVRVLVCGALGGSMLATWSALPLLLLLYLLLLKRLLPARAPRSSTACVCAVSSPTATATTRLHAGLETVADQMNALPCCTGCGRPALQLKKCSACK